MKKYLFICAFFITQQAIADIYQCREKDTITFVDASTKDNFKHCVLMTEHKAQTSPEPVKRTSSKQANEAIKIDPQTQEARDIKRKQILLSELKTEEEALQSSKNASIVSDERVHQKNIELIQKEIHRLETQRLK